MRNVLKHRRDLRLPALLSEQEVLDGLECFVDKMVPSTGITVQHRRCLNVLFAIRPASPALESVVRVALCVGAELEKFAKATK